MKRFFIVLFIFCIVLLPCSCKACGGDEAKIVGIWASVVSPDAEDCYISAFSNESTVAENDYILEAGKAYHLTVSYSAYGGSKYPGFHSFDGIKLLYAAEALDIALCENQEDYSIARYELICKRTADYIAVLVEVDGIYSYNVIISAV